MLKKVIIILSLFTIISTQASSSKSTFIPDGVIETLISRHAILNRLEAQKIAGKLNLYTNTDIKKSLAKINKAIRAIQNTKTKNTKRKA